ncbi:hypothetical protein [Planctomycetes bacterium TBK1r]|uniref:hypothetical protein n=1 Tax=Stieleria magnilauensis TaxID=2527963 RepID=UPI00119F8DE1
MRRLRHESLEQRRLLVATVSVTVQTPVAVPEAPLQRIVYTFNRDETAGFLAVPFELSGDATYDVDYTARERDRDTIWLPDDAPVSGDVVGTATFFPGESTVDLIITARTDSISEPHESVVVTLVEADEFGPVYSGAALLASHQDTEYFIADDENRLGTVDIETGVVEVLGSINTADTITDIAFTEDGRLFAISFERLYEVRLADASAGLIPVTSLGQHGISGANTLIDARDGDFGSETGDLFAVGDAFLDLQRIDLELVNDEVVMMNVTTVFDIDGTLQSQLMPFRFVASGDLDYLSGGQLALSASGYDQFGAFDPYDSLIEIKTPGTGGVIENWPEPAQDSNEDFDNVFGYAFDGNDSFAFSGHTMLSVGQFSRDTSRELEMTGRPYLIGTPAVARGRILGDQVTQNTIGLYQGDISLFHLKESFTSGPSDIYFGFGPSGNLGWNPLSGDWNGDGIDTVGFYQGDISLFHLKDTFTGGASDQYFAFGPGGNAGWIPLAGDWDGDGVDTIGLYQPDISLFHLKDSFTPGASDHYFAFGPGGNAGWTPLAGDWNGDGIDTVGLYQPDISLFHLKDSFTPGASDHYVQFGPGGGGRIPLVGDWDGDGVDTIGLYRGDTSFFQLKDSFTPGAADHSFAFGPGGNAGWVPLSGDWNGRTMPPPPPAPLASAGSLFSNPVHASLDQVHADPVLQGSGWGLAAKVEVTRLGSVGATDSVVDSSRRPTAERTAEAGDSGSIHTGLDSTPLELLDESMAQWR